MKVTEKKLNKTT